ncbi:hypothetical protein L9F63_024192, partial [Diploptera punctata]
NGIPYHDVHFDYKASTRGQSSLDGCLGSGAIVDNIVGAISGEMNRTVASIHVCEKNWSSNHLNILGQNPSYQRRIPITKYEDHTIILSNTVFPSSSLCLKSVYEHRQKEVNQILRLKEGNNKSKSYSSLNNWLNMPRVCVCGLTRYQICSLEQRSYKNQVILNLMGWKL